MIDQKTLSGLPLAAALAMLATHAQADEPQTDSIPALVITAAGEEPPQWLASEELQAATLYELDAEQVGLFGGKGGSNPYTAVSRLPGVQVQGIDAYGLVNPVGGSKGLRVRGEMASHGANGTVEGVPLNGPGPGPGYLFLLDDESIARISMALGPIPPDRFSLYDTVGQLDTAILWPQMQAGGRLTVGVGEDGFQRQFLRVDSGLLPGGNALFVSASAASADKWRGSGESPERRENFALGFSHASGPLEMKLFAAHNAMVADNYRGLTWAQAQNSSLYDEIDYDPVPTGSTAASWVNWQGYNRQDFETTAYLAELGWQFSDDTRLLIKPFYSKEEGYYTYASGNFVRYWEFDHDHYGFTSELETRWGNSGLSFGYALVSMEPPAPPTRWLHYAPDASGGLTFKGWAMLADVSQRHELHNLFATAEHDFGRLNFKAGLRFVHDRLPGIDWYNPAGVTSEDFDTAVEQSRGIVAERSVEPTSQREWAPWVGLRYPLGDSVQWRAAAGRNLGAPAFDAFQKPMIAGITKQQLWEDGEMEIGDSVETGLDFDLPRGRLQTTLYYTRYRNKHVELYDPVYQAAYSQNIGKAHQLGLTLAGDWQLASQLQLFGNLSFMRSQFDEDLRLSADSLTTTEGERLPDVPARMASLGLNWQFGRFTLTPVMQHMGDRYADLEHSMKMEAYTLTNVDLVHDLPTTWGQLETRLAVINLFDRRYIGFNNANETSAGSTFFPGAPRTVVGSVSLSF